MPAITEPNRDLPPLYLAVNPQNPRDLILSLVHKEKQLLAPVLQNFIAHSIDQLNIIKQGRQAKLEQLKVNCYFLYQTQRTRTEEQIHYCEQLVADLALFQEGKVRTVIQIPTVSTFSQRIKALIDHNQASLSSAPMSALRGLVFPAGIAIFSDSMLEAAKKFDDIDNQLVIYSASDSNINNINDSALNSDADDMERALRG